MSSDVMASIYIEHEFPTRGMRQVQLNEHDDLDSPSDAYQADSAQQATSRVPTSELPKKPWQRPDIPRSSTDPTSASSLPPPPPPSHNTSIASAPQPIHRNRSPYSRSHLRSRSSGAALGAPVMTRSHSWAGNAAARTSDINVSSPGSLSPSNSTRSPARTRSPYRSNEDTAAYNTPQKMWYDVYGGSAIESIQEDSELDLTPRGQGSLPLATNTFSRSSSLRRRPTSPLHSLSSATSHPSSYSAELNSSVGTSSSQHSPSLAPQRFNETYPPLHHYASSSSFSSISSTPTSQRSRSPSISSLETIEDVPDLESEAIEAERIQHLKIAAERAEHGDDNEDGMQRRSLDVPRGFGFSRASGRERKRWSVCGGERRADLDLETIWED